MAEEEKPLYKPGHIVWVKLGSVYWPGQVILDTDTQQYTQRKTKPPLAIVKFFQEDTIEYVKNLNMIFDYRCEKKNDFIKKGLQLHRTNKHAHMKKFPEDVKTAESLTGGNPDICNDPMFAPEEKTSYAGLFGSPATNTTPKKNTPGKRGRPSASASKREPTPKITHPRILQKYLKGTSDYKARILVQENKRDDLDCDKSFDDPDFIAKEMSSPTASKMSSSFSTPQSSDMYTCHSCNFTSTRLNVMILHNKSHGADASPSKVKTPTKTPKKTVKKEAKTTTPSPAKSKPRGRPKKSTEDTPPAKVPKIAASPARKPKEEAKPKTDVEIKSSLLADWTEDSNESVDLFTSLKLAGNQQSNDSKEDPPAKVEEQKEADASDKTLEKRGSCFDFDEDEDLSIETIGRKIPRLSKTETKKTPDIPDLPTPNEKSPVKTKPVTDDSEIQTEDLDSEIKNLLEETVVPEVPNIPNQLKFTENFQKGKAIKFPDKEKEIEEKPPAKAIFKTKTFFRSRHSRSQDAIEKYIADNTTNARSPIYGDEEQESKNEYDSTKDYSISDDLDSTKHEEIPDVKTVKLAPKIELKKMKAALSDKLQKQVNEVVESLDSKVVKKPGKGNAEDVLNSKISTIAKNKEDEFPKKITEIQIKKDPEESEKIEISETKSSERILRSKSYINDKVKSPQSTPKAVPQAGKEKILNFDIDRNSPNPIKQDIILKRTSQSEINAAELKANHDKSYTPKLSDKWKNSETFTIKETLSAEPTIKIEKKILNKTLAPQTDDKCDIKMIDSTPPILSDNSIIEKTINPLSADPPVVSTAASESKSVSNHSIVMSSPNAKTTTETFVTKQSNVTVKSISEKTPSPNILSKSKVKTVKHLVVVDSNGTKKKLILPNDIQDTPLLQAAANIVKQPGSVLSNNTEKFLIVSSDSNSSTPLGKRQPRIIRSTQPGKTQILLNTTELPKTQSQTVSKIIPSRPAGENSTLMIITNADKQPKYILTPEQSKIILPKKQNTTQTILIPKGAVQHVKGKAALSQTLISNRGQVVSQISGNTLITSTGQIIPTQSQISTTTNTRTILTAKPNQAILTSRGQLITESNVFTAQNKNVLTKPAPTTGQQQLKFISKVQMSKEPEFSNQNIILQQSSQVQPLLMKTNQKKVIATQQTLTPTKQVPKGLEQTILLSANQGTILTLTAAQFEQLKKSGQLVFQSDDKLQPPKIVQKVVRQKPKIQTYSATSRISPPPLAAVKNEVVTPIKKTKFQTETIPKPEPAPPKNLNVVTKPHIAPRQSDSQQSIIDLQNLDELIPATTITTMKVDQHGNPIVSENNQVINQEVPPLKQAEVEKPSVSNSNQDILAAAASGSLGDGLLAVPGENFGGPPGSFYLCMEENGTFTPINDQPLVLEDNQLVPMVTKPVPDLALPIGDDSAHLPMQLEAAPLPVEKKPVETQQQLLAPAEQPEANILINFGNQQILIDQQTLLSLTSGEGQQLVTSDGQLLLQGQLQQILTALASNPEISKMMTSNAQVVPAESQIVTDNSSYTFTSSVPNTGNQDILAAALANTDVFHQDSVISDDLNISTAGTDSMIIEMDSLSPNFHNLNASVSVHSHVSETSSTLNQPIMSPVEIPTKKKILNKNTSSLLTTSQISEMMIPQNIEDSLAVIGVTPPNIPSSLDLPITVTNPKIAPKTTNPLTLACGVVYQSNNTIVSPSMMVSDVDGSMKLDTPICSIGSDDTKKNTPYLLTTVDNKIEEAILESGSTSMPTLDDTTVEEKDNKVYPPISMPLLTDIEEQAEPVDKVEENDQSKMDNDEITFDESIKTNITDITEETCAKETAIIHDEMANAKDGISNSESPSKPDAETEYDLDSEIQPSSVPSETCDSLEHPNSPYAVLNMVGEGQILNDNNSLSEEFNVGCDLDESNIENSLSQGDIVPESDASSECSAEIPLQPSISVSENLIHNITGTENNSSDETNGIKRYSDEEDLINGDEIPSKKPKYDER